MYDPRTWPDLSVFLHEIRTLAQPRNAARALEALRTRLGLGSLQPYPQVVKGFAGLWSSDAANTDRASAWADAARAADHEHPYFGRAWIWFGSIVPRGRVTNWTATMLVIGNRETRPVYQDAVSAARIIPSSRLLTLEAIGPQVVVHTC